MITKEQMHRHHQLLKTLEGMYKKYYEELEELEEELLDLDYDDPNYDEDEYDRVSALSLPIEEMYHILHDAVDEFDGMIVNKII